MNPLPLDSLRIQNFRTFKDLTIDRLGRVNLIVGKNNTGKTALLESIYAWANPSYFSDLDDLARGQIQRPKDEVGKRHRARRYEFVRHLIHGRPTAHEFEREWPEFKALTDEDAVAVIGPENPASRLYLQARSGGSNEGPWFRLEGYRGTHTVGEDDPCVVLSTTDQPDEWDTASSSGTVRVQYVNSSGLSSKDENTLWDNAIRSSGKRHIVRVLQVIEDDVEGLDVILNGFPRYLLSGDRLRIDDGGERIWMISMRGLQKLIPISTMGEGMERGLHFALAQLGAQNGILLIDEFENGLHHSIQRDLWEMVFDTARELNVQVFATTHSHDCVKAFQRVADNHDEEGILVKLRRKRSNGEVAAVTASEDELQSALVTGIDPR